MTLISLAIPYLSHILFLSQEGTRLVLLLMVMLVILSLLFFVFRLYLNSHLKNEMLREKNDELEKMNSQLLASENQLSKLNATKAKLFSIIGHDLRGSMNAIIGFSEILVKKQKVLSDEERLRYSNIINLSASKLYMMMENLLDWSRAQGENIRFTPDLFDLHSVALNVVTLLEINAYSKGIELVSEVPRDFIVYADKIMTSSILRNLIDNALKYTRKDGKISISAARLNKWVEISVSDTGQGMSVETVKDLFRIDSRVSTEGTDNEKGTGLGLLLCKDFVEMHGGQIWVKSQPGEGSVFSFTLPSKENPKGKHS